MGADQDEARARATLADMQAKLARGPHDALGITQVASFDEIRGAFLELTKVYHPARFARMATELQKLSNEVFLGIKGAHDALVKALGPSPRANRSSAMPPFRVQGSGPNQVVDAPTQPPKPPVKVTQSMPALAQPPGRPTPLPPNVVPSQPTQPITMRPMTPSGARPAAPPRVPTPAMGVPVKQTQPLPTMSRTKTGQTAVLPAQITPPAPLSARPGTPPQQRPVTPTNPTNRAPTHSGPPPAAFDEKAVLRTVAELVKQGRWSDATVALQQLAAKAPTKENRAMLSYARAREAQAAGLIDDAIHELKRALEINPGLVPAKTALAELQTRRK